MAKLEIPRNRELFWNHFDDVIALRYPFLEREQVEMGQPSISVTGFWDKSAGPVHRISLPLAQWMTEYLGHEKHVPLYDFGCGNGHYMQKFEEAGFERLTGFEGDPPQGCHHMVRRADITKPINVPEPGNVVCLEVLEHIPAQYEAAAIDNLVRAIKPNCVLITSWAVRGQTGHGHVNEKNNDEVIPLFTTKGLEYLDPATHAARARITDSHDIDHGHLPWFKNTLLVFWNPVLYGDK